MTDGLSTLTAPDDGANAAIEAGPECEIRSDAGEHALDQIWGWSAAAVELAKTWGVAPTPKVYEVCYVHISGANKALSDALEAASVEDRLQDIHNLERLHADYCADHGQASRLMALNDRLDGELKNVQQRLDVGARDNKAMQSKLGDVRARLENSGPKNDLGSAAQRLTEANAELSERTASLSADLEEAREQVTVLQNELHDMRTHTYVDQLTQLPNRRRFDPVIANEIEVARRTGSALAVALIDVDNFPRLIETWGRTTGDQVLQKCADVLRNSVGARDMLARFDGERFALLMPERALASATEVAEQIRLNFGALRFMDRKSRSRIGRLTLSIGLTRFKQEDTLLSFLKRADELLSTAKFGGADQVKCD